MKCHICASQTSPLQRALVLEKHDVQYFRCPTCGFIQTEAPYWLDEAYAEAINTSDVGLVARNIKMALATRAVIALFFKGRAKFVDYGGGYGLFVRLLRDSGFDFYLYDTFCDNLFAPGLAVPIPDTPQYELVTAFEVFEHLVNPLEDIATIARFSDNIFFSTNLIPKYIPRPGEWWYYGLDHGQHVSIYSHESLRRVAKQLNMKLYTNGVNLHLLTKKVLPTPIYRLAVSWPGALGLSLAARHRSLIPDDYFRISGRRLQ